MDFLISLYDNSLIYYPNVFFAALFLLSILVIVLTIKGIIYLNRELRKIVKKIKNNIGKIRINQIRIKKIKIKERKKTSFAQMIRAFFQRKSISLFYLVKSLTVFFVHIVRVFFIRINTALGYIGSQIERIIKKIEKEVFIQE